MNISSAQPSYSITSGSSIDTITITNGTSSYYSTDTITLDLGATGSSSGYVIGAGVAGAGASTITFTGSGAGGFTAQNIGSIDPSTFTWKNPEEFVDAFPSFDRIKDMCETYPGLKIAYEKFVTTYRLVKDDYDNPNTKK